MIVPVPTLHFAPPASVIIHAFGVALGFARGSGLFNEMRTPLLATTFVGHATLFALIVKHGS
jgi:hypothetical protein